MPPRTSPPIRPTPAEAVADPTPDAEQALAAEPVADPGAAPAEPPPANRAERRRRDKSGERTAQQGSAGPSTSARPVPQGRRINPIRRTG